jgi:dihydropyrimidine dehydrogenase (NAD+) subunit PreT
LGDIQAKRLLAKACAENFRDIAAPFHPNEARVAAERCLFCHDAPCVTACPTSIDIPLFIRQIATGQPVPAAKTIFDANIMGAMCARVCPTENLCEGACVKVAAEDNPVEIGRLQRFATDAAMGAGKQFYRKGAATGRKVAVVGAGPAGLACAHALALAGHAVTIYEAAKKGGGLNEFGIAAYKATDDIAQRELDYILAVGGISVKYGKALGRDVSLADLRATHDAVFLGMGLGGNNSAGLEAGIPGVMDAVDFISEIRQSKNKANVPVGRSVVVIGGGMTAIDAATQAKLVGAESATIVYRRGKKDMGASAHEQDVAQTRGVLIRHNLRPVKLTVEGKGKGRSAAGVTFEYTVAKAGKLEGTGETMTIPCDQVLVAVGQTLLMSDLKDAGLALDKGRIKVGRDRRTSLPGVWAGGDCIAGGLDLTVAAVEDGKVAARGIDAFFAGRK